MKFLVVISCVVSASLGEAQVKDAAASTDQVARLAPLDPYYAPFSPLGLPGAVSSTNVNVPGKFSYVVNAVHPTQPETVAAPLAPLTGLAPEAVSEDLGSVSGLRIAPLPAYNGYPGLGGFNGYNGLGLGYNGWAGAGYYGNYGLNGLNAPLNYGGYPGYGGYGLPYYG